MKTIVLLSIVAALALVVVLWARRPKDTDVFARRMSGEKL